MPRVLFAVGGLLLLICSIGKLNEYPKEISGVETFLRFSLSLTVSIALHSKGLIHGWQLACFFILAIVTGTLQIYVCFHMEVVKNHHMIYNNYYRGRRINFDGCKGKSETNEADL